jgi:hypothetical protein
VSWEDGLSCTPTGNAGWGKLAFPMIQERRSASMVPTFPKIFSGDADATEVGSSVAEHRPAGVVSAAVEMP